MPTHLASKIELEVWMDSDAMSGEDDELVAAKRKFTLGTKR